MIGISFYLNDPLAESRLETAGKQGVKRAFTSLHIPEESGDLADRAKKLLQKAKEEGIEVYADVSYRTPSHLGLENLNELKNLGVGGLRLDDFFQSGTIIQLSKEFKIAVNASILFEDDLNALLALGLEPEQVIAWHNFYPRPETGLDEQFFREQNALFQKLGIPVAAYVPGDGEKRGPLYEGLPTLENHRNLDPFLAALELYQCGIEDVYIGDPEVSGSLLQKIMEFEQTKTIAIRVEGLVSGEFSLRPDFARDVLRLMDTRRTEPVSPANTVARSRGTITMDNDLYGRYRGEVQVVLNPLPADERVNVIGRVIEEDIPLLSYIRPGQRIKMIEV
ncbi:MupG family TIM beta-alpha barrel fold protein [Neobacillus terrae]|uniref:MupG family TIM beta-alpha barrel fold protein n=1 Tax=Neobacillus terrae TaxID=3034837 RepID=UPI0014072760|nr:MupG family TIM beta-alpha barrel fold protein [Neobacillus terrae]NHM33743.1 DUF871 domain-containing protein [Neobacillus terrae]